MEFIENRMKQKGFNASQLANKAGCNVSSVTRLMKGEIVNPSWGLITSLCKALDIKMQVKIDNKTLIIK